MVAFTRTLRCEFLHVAARGPLLETQEAFYQHSAVTRKACVNASIEIQ